MELQETCFPVVLSVVEGLPYNVLLGNPFIKQYRLFRGSEALDWQMNEDASHYFMNIFRRDPPPLGTGIYRGLKRLLLPKN